MDAKSIKWERLQYINIGCKKVQNQYVKDTRREKHIRQVKQTNEGSQVRQTKPHRKTTTQISDTLTPATFSPWATPPPPPPPPYHATTLSPAPSQPKDDCSLRALSRRPLKFNCTGIKLYQCTPSRDKDFMRCGGPRFASGVHQRAASARRCDAFLREFLALGPRRGQRGRLEGGGVVGAMIFSWGEGRGGRGNWLSVDGFSCCVVSICAIR